MSFVSEMSMPVKVVLGVGIVLLVYLGIAALTGKLPPYTRQTTQQERGIGGRGQQ